MCLIYVYNSEKYIIANMKKPTKQTPQINLPLPVLWGFLKHILPVKSGIKSSWQMLTKGIYILIFGKWEYVPAHGMVGRGCRCDLIKSLGMRRVFCSIQVGCDYPSGLCQSQPMENPCCAWKKKQGNSLIHETSGRNAGWGPILDLSQPAPYDSSFPLF